MEPHNMNKKNIVISGINIFQAGALTIYYNLLDCLVENNYSDNNNITIFVHKKSLFDQYSKYFNIIELPKSRNNYFFRLYYEYIYFYFYSMGKNIDIWFSLHDTSPNVISLKRYVYCHNPLPFISDEVKRYLKCGTKSNLSQKLYSIVYRINIKKNDAVIVQQEWLRKEFQKKYNIQNVIVARPSVIVNDVCTHNYCRSEEKYTFIYASYPRNFKNFEVILEAARNLINYKDNFIIKLTLNGTENKYSSSLYEKYKDLENIVWLGLLDKEQLYKEYDNSDCLIFPSLLETWGLPITEYKIFNKEILCSDFPYAYETIGDYRFKRFFNPMNPNDLSNKMKDLIDGYTIHDDNKEITLTGPTYYSWIELIRNII